MFKYKKFACFFFFIFSLFWSPCTYTMDLQGGEDDDMYDHLPNKVNKSTRASLSEIPEIENPSSALLQTSNEQALLEQLYGRTVSRVRVPESVRQVISGVASLIPLFPTGQVFVPLALIGLLSLGLTPNIVPDVGWESWALVGGVAIPIVIAALIGTYNGASNFFKPTSSDAIDTQRRAFERPYSRLESWSQSYPTQFVEFVFLGSLFFGILMNVESRVTGWGDYRILGGIFGSLAAVAVYFILVRASNNMGRYSYRSYNNHDEEAQKKAILEPIEETKEYIKDNGLSPTEARALAHQLNVAEKPLATINGDILSESDTQRSTISLDDRDNPLDDGEDSLFSSEHQIVVSSQRSLSNFEDLSKPKYQRVFEKMIAIKYIIPPWKREWHTWSTRIAKYSSRIAQIGSIPAQELIAFALPYSLFTYLAAPVGVTLGMSIAATVGYSLFLPGITIRENALIWKEHEQLLRLYKPQTTCGYFGERLAPFAARAGTLLYFTFPMTDFIRNSLFHDVIGITNVPAQICLLVPFMAGIGLAGPSQFLDYTYTTLANWVATGGRVTLPCCDYSFKLSRLAHPLYHYLCCCWCCADEKGREGALEALETLQGDRQHAFELVERLQEMENHTFYLNPELTKYLTDQLAITPPSLEDSHLLADTL